MARVRKTCTSAEVPHALRALNDLARRCAAICFTRWPAQRRRVYPHGRSGRADQSDDLRSGSGSAHGTAPQAFKTQPTL